MGQTFCHDGGALNLAGSVTARKNQRATTSDWMDLEKHDRGTRQRDRPFVMLSWTFCHETQSGQDQNRRVEIWVGNFAQNFLRSVGVE